MPVKGQGKPVLRICASFCSECSIMLAERGFEAPTKSETASAYAARRSHFYLTQNENRSLTNAA